MHLYLGLVIVAGLVLLSLVWWLVLRRIVREQTALITEEVKEKTLLEERHRVARELHDTLQQHLTGVGLQLDHVHAKYGDDHQASEALSVARRMVDHCRKEVRDSIIELREVPSSSLSLADRIDELLLDEIRLGDTRLEIETKGETFALSDFKARHILRIAQEAVRNALHHGEATLITLTFTYGWSKVVVTVKDDGKGFDMSEDASSGHFGLVGMRERAMRLDADLQIESQPDEGTWVTLTVPCNTEQ